MKHLQHSVRALVVSLSMGLLSVGLLLGGPLGCQGAVGAGQSVALGGDELVEITDDMAQKLVASEAVQQAINREGTLAIVVLPVENYMTAEVLPRGPAQAFTARLRTLLSRSMPQAFAWIMNRDAYYELRGQELQDVDLGPAPDAINPRYALVARFYSLAKESREGASRYYLCVFELTNLQDRTVLWNGTYELKKTAVRGFLD